MSIDPELDVKRSVVTLLLCCLLPCLLHANGDPVIEYSARVRSSNPVPLKMTDVQVVREDLRIEAGLPYSSIHVTYFLKNNSAEPVHVDYGFPVDFYGHPDDANRFDQDQFGESLYERGIGALAVRDIRFRLNGTELPWTRADEVIKDGVEMRYDFETEEEYEADVEMARLWTYTVLDIPAGETAELQVDYSVLCRWSTGLYFLGRSPLLRYFPYFGQIRYDFTPAQHWGNGKTDFFSFTLDYSGLPAYLIDSVEPELEMAGPLVKGDRKWTLEARDFDFAEAKPLELSFRYRGEIGVPVHSWGDPLKACAVPVSAYELQASGAQDKYPVSQLTDGDVATAWVAPGDGVGATLDIDFPTPCRVSDLAFYNGYHKSEALWTANSRIEKVRLEITRADGFQDRPVDLDVSRHSLDVSTLLAYADPCFGLPTLVPVTSLVRQICGRYKGMGEDGLSLFEEVPFSSEYVKHIRLTVLSVTPGTKYKDLCLSELTVLDGFKIIYE